MISKARVETFSLLSMFLAATIAAIWHIYKPSGLLIFAFAAMIAANYLIVKLCL